VPGIGPITAPALVATVGEVSNFASARHFAAWIGLVPKQNSTGGKPRQGGISKAGDHYLRRLLVPGASTVVRHNRAKAGEGWLAGLIARRPAMVAAVAQANKTARIAWALMARGGSYNPRHCIPQTVAAAAAWENTSFSPEIAATGGRVRAEVA